MKRGEFLKNLGLSGAALMSIYCLGGVTACSSEAPDPQTNPGSNPGGGNPGGGTPGGGPAGFTGNARLSAGRIDFTLDLNADGFKKLLTNGEYAYPAAGDVIVARVRNSTFVALAKACPHQPTQPTTVYYRLNQDDFFCPNHNSEFSTTGAVESGPAPSGLQVFRTELNPTTNLLRVFQG